MFSVSQQSLLLVVGFVAVFVIAVPISPGTEKNDVEKTTNTSRTSNNTWILHKKHNVIVKKEAGDELPEPIHSSNEWNIYDDDEETLYSYQDLRRFDPSEDDIDFMGSSSEEINIADLEYPPIPDVESEEIPPLTMEEKHEANLRFCREAQQEDEHLLKEQDGRHHPKFEEVPGVGYYRFHAKPRNWEEARRICEQEGSHLVILNSEDEATALLEIHARCPHILATHFNSYSYLGVHDIHSEGDFETVFGEPLNETGYVKWAWNQPDDAHHDGENCVSLNRQGFFNDVPCYIELPYFCEHN